MALVDYSDSEEDQRETSNRSPRHAQEALNESSVNSKVPLPPPSFQNLYATTTRVATADDPSLHGGRKRNTPHAEGRWPTHVYIECESCKAAKRFHQQGIHLTMLGFPSQAEASGLTRVLDSVRSARSLRAVSDDNSSDLHSLLYSDLGVPLPLHISLSRSLALQGDERATFRRRLESAIQNAGIAHFSVGLNCSKWATNYEGTRAFLVMGLDLPRYNELNRLLHACNTACVSMGLPELYASDKQASHTETPDNQVPDRSDAFHFSIGWSLASSANEALREASQFEVLTSPLTVHCSLVKLKMGNEVIDIPLGS